MREDFIQFIWRFQRFDQHNLRTVKGEEISINQAGFPNEQDSGPDFSDASIIIDEIVWYGHIEIHVNASDWYKHNHHKDPAYNNVILHVVLNYDCDIKTLSDRKVPTLDLKPRIDVQVKQVYSKILQLKNTVPCSAHLQNVRKQSLYHWFDRLAHQRLERKSGEVIASLVENKGDWEQTTITMMCKYLGFNVNAQAFSLLAKKIDWKWIQRNYREPNTIYSYLFGNAGFLEQNYSDDYFDSLKNIYDRLQKHYKLNHLPSVIWKYSRMRPSNFPSLRIAQLASLFNMHGRIWASLKVCDSVDDYYNFFNVSYDDYWVKHYDFGKLSKVQRKKPGKMGNTLLIINFVAPLLYAYGRVTNDSLYQERSMNLWQNLPPENNKIIRLWKKNGIDAKSAWDTQALIELKKDYCDYKKCLECHIGKSILLDIDAQYYNSLSIKHSNLVAHEI